MPKNLIHSTVKIQNLWWKAQYNWTQFMKITFTSRCSMIPDNCWYSSCQQIMVPLFYTRYNTEEQVQKLLFASLIISLLTF